MQEKQGAFRIGDHRGCHGELVVRGTRASHGRCSQSLRERVDDAHAIVIRAVLHVFAVQSRDAGLLAGRNEHTVPVGQRVALADLERGFKDLVGWQGQNPHLEEFAESAPDVVACHFPGRFPFAKAGK